MNPNRLPEQHDWTEELLTKIDTEVSKIASDFKLDTYPNQLEIITSEQMMDAYSSVGLPTYYNHWSFGKSFIKTEKEYKSGEMGLAYEIVINSNPCIAYLMEENSLTMQALVIAHASYGHNSFFKGNYLFRQWTDAAGIIDYMAHAKNYISRCEHEYGNYRVEKLLDNCHALMNYGVYKYKRPPKVSANEKARRKRESAEYAQATLNPLWSTIPTEKKKRFKFLANEQMEPNENILRFLGEKSPHLEDWERRIIGIVCDISQYFYPQRQTQVMNEGWATFWHYTILNEMYDKDLVSDGFMMEFLQSHAAVVRQHPMSKMNPYALGFAMMRDIRRICQNPTEEDLKWFPDIAGSDWLETLDYAMRNYRDESFIRQFLSPKVIRDFKLFAILNDSTEKDYIVLDIHDDDGYRSIRNKLAAQYDIGDYEPDIQIINVANRTDRTLALLHQEHRNRDLNGHTVRVLGAIGEIWRHPVRLFTKDDKGNIKI